MTDNKKILILDGYNVIHKIPKLACRLKDSLNAARNALAGYLVDWKHSHPHFEVYIIFDGQDTQALNYSHIKIQGIDCYFTRTNEEADERIKAIVRNTKNPERIIVLSDDNNIFNNCRRVYGAQVYHPMYLEKKEGVKGYAREISSDKKISTQEENEITKWYKKQLEGQGD